jgi:hypothetical protein
MECKNLVKRDLDKSEGIAMRGFLSALAAAAGTTAVLWGATPAAAASSWIEVNPSSIQAGSSVAIRASCQDNTSPATAKSSAFGQVTLVPQNGFLVGSVTIPANTRARTYSVRLSCPNGSSARTSLNVVGMERPTLGPATGGGGTAPNDAGPLLLAGGLATLAVGAGVGVMALRRRRVA